MNDATGKVGTSVRWRLRRRTKWGVFLYDVTPWVGHRKSTTNSSPPSAFQRMEFADWCALRQDGVRGLMMTQKKEEGENA